MKTFNCNRETPSSFREKAGVRRTAIVLMVPLALVPYLCAQDSAQSGSGSNSSPASVYGAGERPTVSYAGEHIPQNILLLSTGYEVAYDSNPLGQPSGASPDEEQSASTQFTVLHQSAKLAATINYQPYFQFYKTYSQYNHFNQTLSADGVLNFTPHLSLRLRDDFIDQTGLYGPPNSEYSPPGISGPTSLNSSVYFPLDTQRANSSRVDVLYQQSARTSLSAFGGYALRSFSEGTTVPYGTTVETGGAEYSWRASEHATLGLLAVYNRINLAGDLQPGSASQMQSAMLLPTAAWKPRPSLALEVFAGPQAIRQSDVQGSLPKGISSPIQMELAAGGSLVRESEGTALTVSGQRLVTDGGGLQGFVVNSEISAGIRRRLHGTWDLTLEYDYARNRWIPLEPGSGQITAQGGQVSIVHPLRGNMVLHINYEFIEQTPQGDSGPASEFHRNRVATGVTWNWHTIRLGH